MRNKLTPAKTPLPKFASDKQAAEYFENHSVAGIWDQLPEARRVVRATTKTFEKPVSSDEIAAKASKTFPLTSATSSPWPGRFGG